MKKVALCLSGHVRNIDEFKENTLEIIETLNADVFISTWERDGVGCVFWADEGVTQEGYADIDSVKEIYKPKKIVVSKYEEYEELSEQFPGNFPNSRFASHINIKNTLLMFTKFKETVDLVKEYEKENNFKYDMVIRGRFDVSVESVGEEILPNTVYCKRHPDNKIPDPAFFYADSDTIEKLTIDKNFYTEELINSAQNSEDIFTKRAQSSGVNINVCDEITYVLRGRTY